MQVKDMQSFKDALATLENIKGINKGFIMDSLKEAILSAYLKTNGRNSRIEVEIDEDFNIYISSVKVVVEEVEDEYTELSLEEAKKVNKDATVGDELIFEEKSEEFKRNAIQNAKHMVIQKIREAERQNVMDKFSTKRDRIASGTIRRIDASGNIFLDIDGIEALLPIQEQSPGDMYRVGISIKVCVLDVISQAELPKIVVSRRSPRLIEELFQFEVPEIAEGIVRIYAVAREAGTRSKVAVYSDSEAIDPVGACIGGRGSRVKAIINELNGENIDIVIWDPELSEFIKNALKPAEINSIELISDGNLRVANVRVDESQLALAIGRKGQNARLASKLTETRLNIESIEG